MALKNALSLCAELFDVDPKKKYRLSAVNSCKNDQHLFIIFKFAHLIMLNRL